MEIQGIFNLLCLYYASSIYNQVSRLYEVFVFNEGKSEFPARRIMGINVLIMIVFGRFWYLACLYSITEDMAIYSL